MKLDSAGGLPQGRDPKGFRPELIFCENETNVPRLFGGPPQTLIRRTEINDHVMSTAATIQPGMAGGRRWLAVTRLLPRPAKSWS